MDLCLLPAGVLPDGVIPDFENPPSLAPAMIAVITILTVSSVVVISGRIYVNRSNLHASDYLMLIAFVLSVGMSAVCLLLRDFARHQWDIPVCWFDASYMKTLFAVEIIIPVGSFFPKAAILVLYLQLFSAKRWIRPAVYIGLVFNFLTYSPLVPSAIYYSAPRGGETWATMALSTSPQRGLYMSTLKAGMSVALNLYILAIPLPILFKLELPVSKRLQLVAVFATAAVGVVASIVDLVYCTQLLNLEDSTWKEACVSITTIVENNVAILVGSMPAFAIFLKVHVAKSRSVQAWRSRVSRKRQDSSVLHSDPRQPIRTFGSSDPKVHPYYELTESALLKSRCTTDGEVVPTPSSPDRAIVRTVGIYQQSDTTPLKRSLETV